MTPATQSLEEQVILKIRRNRISTTEVADCLGKTGAISGLTALNRGFHRVGPVYWTYAYNESNWEFHDQVSEAPGGSIVLTEAIECGDRAVYGGLVAKFLILYRQVAGLVMCGNLRDAPFLIRENWPIWCKSVTPIGCHNRKNTEFPIDLLATRRAEFARSIAVCDDSGVVIIPGSSVNAQFLDKLDWIEEQEDVWFDCIDRLKWNTFDTVCEKKYTTDAYAPARPRFRV